MTLHTGTIRRSKVSALVLSLTLLAGITWGRAPARAAEDPRTEPIPTIDYTMDEKSVVTTVRFDTRTATQTQSVQVTRGRARSHLGDPPLLRVRTTDDRGAQLQQFNDWHPSWVYFQKENGKEARKIEFPATGTIVSQFEPELKQMTITDVALNQQVATIDLQPAVRDFCQTNQNDPECATDLAITKTDSADPVGAGEELTYTIAVANSGANPAQSPRVIDTLPASVTYVRSSADCTEAPTGTLTCDLARLAAGETSTFTITVMVPPDLVYRNGGPLTIQNSATVVNRAGSDPDPSDNTATQDTRVIAKADLAVTDLAVTQAPPDIVIGQSEQVTLRTTYTNLGPSTPIDVTLRSSATAAPGISATSTTASVNDTALAKDEVRTKDRTFTVACDGPGLRTVTFGSRIDPTNPADVDPNLSNNARQLAVTFDCVVPIALNIKPGSFPNVVQPEDDGVVPMAALTTRAGEYGLPIAFNALAIDAKTVRFGPRMAVRTGGGTPEVHGKGHPELSYELDERTRDLDLDLLLHMGNRPSPLSAGDTEGCVKGTYSGSNGTTLRFLGCDSIRTVPK